MVLVATGCNMDMREVLKHPSGTLPFALSNCDCTLKNINKSTIARHIERKSSTSRIYPIAVSMHYRWYELGK